ncbi:MAG: hypothetical protein ACLQD8_07295 [Thermoplasmata archaeon]
MLSGAAIAIAVIALVLAFAIPGPAGAAAPASASSVTASSQYYSGLYNYGSSTCATWAGANVSIVVPASGTIVVLAQVQLVVFHTAGTIDGGELFVDNSTAAYGCSAAYWGSQWFYDTNQSTQEFAPTVSVENVFHVLSAGTYKYAVFGYVGIGTSDDFYSTNMVATYTPG